MDRPSGRRVYESDEHQPGDYWQEHDGSWVIWIPGTTFIGCIGEPYSRHTITEHEDGTITISPSILIDASVHPTIRWHGFLERGIWRQA
jgi:hypothetical protein